MVRLASLLAVLVSSTLLAACGGGGGGSPEPNPAQTARTLVQFGYQSETRAYVYGYESIDRLSVLDAPPAADLSRFAMAFGAGRYWLFAMDRNDPFTVYPFQFNGGGYAYVGNATRIVGAPALADTRSFAVLHDGDGFALYLRNSADPTMIYQFRTQSPTEPFVYGAGGAIRQLRTTGAPDDADFTRWSMFHDGTRYRQVVGRHGADTVLYQFAFNGASYEFGYASISVLSIRGAPSDAFTGQAKILHDGADYRLYQAAP